MNNIKKLGNRQILLLTILVVLAVSLTGSAYADNYVGGKPLETVQEGNVTGDLAVDSYYGFNATDPYNVTYTFNYTIPSDAKIKNATLYVLVYSGTMQGARQTYINVTYNGQLLDNQSLYTTYNYPGDGGNNNTWLLGPGHDEDPYLMVNDHTMRVTSDYLLWYDVTNITKESNWANVCTKGSYDGRIKLITLVVAYNLPGSTTGTRYWINLGHDVSSYNDEEYTGETYFNGTVSGTIKDVTLMIVHAASQDGIYTYNNQNLPNGTYQRRGTYSGYEIWNVTNLYNNETNKFTYHKSPGTGVEGGYYKIILAIQKVTYTSNIDLRFQSVLAPGNTIFALENNTIKCQIKNVGTEKSPPTTLLLYANDELVSNATIPSINPNSNVYVNITDPTIRPATAETLYGNNNQNITYKFVIDPYNEVPETNETNNQYIKNLPLLYNGYKGKRWAYNGSDINTVELYDGQYGIAYYVQPDTTYASGTTGWSNYTVTFNGTQPNIPENTTPITVYLYVPYNWDNKGTQPEEGAALTYLTIQFNQAVFQPGNYTRWYWDQANFGGYPNYKYGLLVYNVTEYYNKNQDNTVNVTLSVPASQTTHTLSMYPFTLLVIYNDNTAPRRQIFIAEESDVLLLGDSTYGTNLNETIAYTKFNGTEINLEDVANATYHTWAGNAGPNEGNVYFNGETLGLNVWQGNSKTAYPEVFNVTGKLQPNNNIAAIQGTDSGGMLALLQILVVEYEPPIANFTANTTIGVLPLTVQFQDLSTGATEWLWEFGDGTNSTEQNPTHTYTQPGTYTITLTVKGPGGQDTLTKQDYITAARVMNLNTNETFNKIQDAINDNDTVNGHTILVGEGNYTENINLNKSLVLKANGLVTIIANNTGNNVINIAANDTQIEGFTVTGATGSGAAGILINGYDRCTLLNNTVINNYYGIRLTNAEACTLRNNSIWNNTRNFGVFQKFVEDIDTSNTINGKPIYYLMNIQDLTLSEDAGFIGLVNTTNVTIDGISISNSQQGILLVNATNCHIENMTLTQNRFGAYIYNCSMITIKDSTITDTDYYAILFLQPTTGNTIENNTIRNCTYAISFYNGVTNSTIQYNNVEGSSDGIDAYGDGNNTIAYNNIIAGGLIVYGANNIVTNNIVKPGTPRSVIYVSGNNNLIANNTVYLPVDKSGIRVEGGGNNTIIANTVIGTNKQGQGIVPLNGDIIQDNIVTNCNYGIWPFNAKNCTIIRNNVTGCNYGIYVTSGGNHTFIDNIIKENTKGIRLTGTGIGASTGNLLYVNYFINNTNQTEGDASNNNWNTTEGGNYWSDYTGDDLNGDGIGDVPYQGDQKPLIVDLMIEDLHVIGNSVQVRVKNNGKADITRIDPTVTFPVKIAYDTQEYLHYIDPLPAGGSQTITQNITISPGSHTITVNILYNETTHYLQDTSIRDANINNNIANITLTRDLKVTNITYNPSNAAGHRELFANEPNTIRVTVFNEGNLDAGQFKVKLIIGEYNSTKIIAGLAANSTVNVTFDDFTPTLTGPITISVIVDSDDEIEENNETNNIYETTGTVYYNGYKGKRYTAGDDINTILLLEGKLGLIYSTGNSTYRGSGSSNWQTPYTVTWTPTNLPIPEGATIKEARLYQPYTWNTALGIPDFTATFNGETINPTAHYNDTKGYGTSNYPSGLLVYNVTGLFRANENNTLVLTAGANTTTALYGSYLLIIYEHENETTKTIMINEEADMLYSRTDYGVNNTEATAYANFSNINSNIVKNATTIIIMASANEANKSKFYFNNQEYTGFWQDYLSGPQIGFSTYNIKEALQNGTNTARIQSYNNGSNGDNVVALGSILILEYEPPIANFTANPTSGVAPLTVQFQDLSTGATEWLWEFGDGTNSTEQNPTHTYTQPGTYNITLTIKGPGGQNTLTKQDYITAYKGPEFILQNFTVAPTSGVAPLNVTASCTLTNTGDVAGDYTAELKIDGIVVANQTVTVGAGETKTVTFTRTLEAGTYNITIDDLTPVTVTVLRPANITAGNLTVTPTSGVAPLNVTASCTLTNTGDVAGDYTAELKIDGIVVANQTVTVGAGETKTVTFTRTLEAGTYNITIDGLAPVNVNVTPAGVSLGDLVSAANTVKAYYERYGRLPSRVVIAGQNYTMSQLLYLLTKATVNINMGNLNPIAPRAVGAPTAPGGSYRHGRLYKPEYVQVAANILSFINRYGRAPNYASTSLGRIPFQRLVYMYTKIIAFYGTNHRLPNYVTAVGAPTAPGGSYRHGRLYKPEYVQVAANILSFINRYGRAPNYASTSLGRIPFQRLVYMYTKIIAFYGTNHRLPNYVTI
ncbi:MAG TPA: DUF3344 domain-containing protein [Methanothermobacter sp.]|nr:DUF3344 domain-containing protein [Methanothermobacter sp.]HPQ03973.1 DUF3344 domain-containing protein [Methanothermobacter sp.]